MNDGDFILGRIERLEKRLETLEIYLKEQDRLLTVHCKMGHLAKDLGETDSSMDCPK